MGHRVSGLEVILRGWVEAWRGDGWAFDCLTYLDTSSTLISQAR